MLMHLTPSATITGAMGEFGDPCWKRLIGTVKTSRLKHDSEFSYINKKNEEK